jgi:hypothetical protein
VVGDGARGVSDPVGEFRGRSGGFEVRQQSRAGGTAGTLLGAGLASAEPDQTEGTTAGIIRVTPVPANGRVSCYGYYGTFKAGTDVIVVDWATASDECFGIATDRTIWHAWPNSGGWKPLPGNGHADHVYRFVEYVNPSSPVYRYRAVFVHADSNNTDWYQWYYPNSGWTGGWNLLR